MSLLLEAEAEADVDLLLIDGLEIEPLPEGLVTAEAAGTSDFAGCRSCDMCSNRPEPEQPCRLWTLVYQAAPGAPAGARPASRSRGRFPPGRPGPRRRENPCRS